jgi:hypothetical protein
MRKIPGVLLSIAALIVAHIVAAAGEEAAWTIVLHANDYVIGPALSELHTPHRWAAAFNNQTGAFQVALRKTAVSIPAPRCRMDYLILEIPSYYPENPKQASVSERRTVYDALVALRTRGSGSITARVEAPAAIAHRGAHGMELAACNLYFVLPLSVEVSTH